MQVKIKRDGLTLRGELTGTTQMQCDEIALLLHGFKGNIGSERTNLLYDVNQELNKAGLPTLRVNFNGCGTSDGKFEDMTVLNEIQDTIAMLEFIKKEIKPKKIYLVGHSQGGVVASMVAAMYPDIIEKLVLLAPAATLVDDAKKGICQGVSYDPKHIPDFVEVDGFRVGGAYFRVAQNLKIYDTAKSYLGPTLLVHGLADTIVASSASEKYAQVYQNATLHLIEGASHGLRGSGNQRQETLKLVREFLN